MLAAKKRPRADNVADGGRNQRVTRFMRRHAGSVHLQAEGISAMARATHELGQTLVAAAAAHARARTEGAPAVGRPDVQRAAEQLLRRTAAADGDDDGDGTASRADRFHPALVTAAEEEPEEVSGGIT